MSTVGLINVVGNGVILPFEFPNYTCVCAPWLNFDWLPITHSTVHKSIGL